MGKRNKVVQIVILAFIVVLGGSAIGAALFKSEEVPVVGSRVPDIKLQQLNGEVRTLSDLKGKAVVLNFWGSWCEPCKREMPALQSAYDQWKNKGVDIIGVNYGEDELVVNNFVSQMGVHFPMWLDRKKTASKAFGIRPLPTTFFVNPDGKVHAIKLGEVTAEELDTYIKQMIGS
ncbi:thiol-disulfide oxidoreductase ResA [Paenibacillus taiwanensis]|uniref:thiol-disulfide oxidoreductase ResA n=1 Tax=Paenibacillus taiwanensis TaxID=401638 RepID=UPI0004167BEB|nr:thiol-disulfide oxidoreductase ResA [Paenibacillus taiwanensis]